MPMRTAPICAAGTLASSRIVDGSTTVITGDPGASTSPALACRALTTPSNGAVMRVLSSCFCAAASRARASAFADEAALRARSAISRSRVAIAPPASSFRARSSSRCAISQLVCAVPAADRAERKASSTAASSSCASSCPRRTRVPWSASVRTTEPPICARIVASRSAPSEPEITGPAVTVPSCTTAMFSVPTVTGAGVVLASASPPPPQAPVASTSVAASTVGRRCERRGSVIFVSAVVGRMVLAVMERIPRPGWPA